MASLKNRIISLEEQSAELEPDAPKRNEYLRQLQRYTDKFLNDIEQTPTYSAGAADAGRLAISGDSRALQDLIEAYAAEVAANGINPASGGHLGYIPGGGLYLSALGDYLAAVTNEYAGVYYASPGAVTIENQLLEWMKSIFGFPSDAVGNLTSGGSIANLIALTAARDHHQVKADKIPLSVVYMSPQVHHCVAKALRIIGLEDVIIRTLELDSGFRIDAEKLNAAIETDRRGGLHPFLVVASAGTTDTGAVDPLADIGRLADANRLWYHIDAAYGGFFVLTKEKGQLLSGIEMADSLVIDPHKGLFLPYGIGAVLVKNREAVLHSHHQTANYMQDALAAESPVNPADVSPELSKHFRGLRMWLPLQVHGVAPFVACLEEKLLLTEYFREKLHENGFELGPPPDLSVSYFWYPSADVDPNDYNQRLMELIHADGRVFLSSTLIDSKFVIRIAILAFRTHMRTVDLALQMILEAKRKADEEFER